MNNVAEQEITLKKGPHRWKKGESGNPKGSPQKPEIHILRDAIQAAKEKRGIHILEHAIDRAYEDNGVLIAILKKLIPDKTHLEHGGAINLLEKYKDYTFDQLAARYRELIGRTGSNIN